MAYFLQPSIVDYVCACGICNPLTQSYFCRHCLKIRCGFCVSHEIDSHFCSNCLENIPSTEAKQKKNRCSSCFYCPCCQHTLSARATSITAPMKPDEEKKEGADVKLVTKKMYYLACLACRWTSRDVGIPDQSIASGSWPEPEFANATRFGLLLEHFQSLVIHNKQEKQDYIRRKTPKQHKFPSLTDRTGLTVNMIRRQMGWSDKSAPKAKLTLINASVATDEIEELPESFFQEELNLKNITTIKQRLSQPAGQPETVNQLYPQHKSLSIKRSLRCRQCEHNVIKPEFNPGSIKYRIQLFASYHMPEVRLVKCDKLVPGTLVYPVFKIINPTINDMTITIMELPTREEEALIIEENKKTFDVSRQQLPSLTPSLTSLSRQVSITEEPRFVNKMITGDLLLPDSSFIINHRDDSAEFDEEIQTQREDAKFVVWRKANKVSIKMGATPHANLVAGDDVLIGFSLQYTYVNTVANTPDKKEPQMHALTSRVYINLGKIGE